MGKGPSHFPLILQPFQEARADCICTEAQQQGARPLQAAAITHPGVITQPSDGEPMRQELWNSVSAVNRCLFSSQRDLTTSQWGSDFIFSAPPWLHRAILARDGMLSAPPISSLRVPFRGRKLSLTDLRGYQADILWTERAQPHSSSDLCQLAGSHAYSAIPWRLHLWLLCCTVCSQNIFKIHLMCVHKGRHYLMPCKGHPMQISTRGAGRVSKSMGRPGFGLAKLLKQKKKCYSSPC